MHPLIISYHARTGSRQAEYDPEELGGGPPRPAAAEGAAAGGGAGDGGLQDRRDERGVIADFTRETAEESHRIRCCFALRPQRALRNTAVPAQLRAA